MGTRMCPAILKLQSNPELESIMNTVSIIEKLKNALNAKESGTMYVNTDNGRAGIISYQNGVLIGAMTGNMRGAEALKFLVSAEQARYKLQERSVQLPDSQPDPEDVVRILGLANTAKTATSATPVQTTSAIDAAFQAKAFAIIAPHLVEYAGPIGAMLVDDMEQSFTTATNGPDAFESVLQVLVQEIGDFNESQQFLLHTRAELAALFGQTTNELPSSNQSGSGVKGAGVANGPLFKLRQEYPG